jgi:hypothetical protein
MATSMNRKRKAIEMELCHVEGKIYDYKMAHATLLRKLEVMDYAEQINDLPKDTVLVEVEGIGFGDEVLEELAASFTSSNWTEVTMPYKVQAFADKCGDSFSGPVDPDTACALMFREEVTSMCKGATMDMLQTWKEIEGEIELTQEQEDIFEKAIRIKMRNEGYYKVVDQDTGSATTGTLMGTHVFKLRYWTKN